MVLEGHLTPGQERSQCSQRSTIHNGLMKIGTCKSEVLHGAKVAFHLRVGGETLPHVEEVKYLGILFTSEGTRDEKVDGWTQ